MRQSLTILLADDEEIVRSTISDYLNDSGHHVVEVRDGAEAIDAISKLDFDLALVDVQMPIVDGLGVLEHVQHDRPDLPVVLISGHGSMETVIQALRLGAADFLNKPVRLRELDAVQEKVLRLRGLQQQGRILRQTIGRLQGNSQRNLRMIGTSPASELVRSQIAQAVEAGCDTILITGETGTGKEVVARELHNRAGQPDSPFIALSCPAVPDSLVESELFGHVRGSFTGAVTDQAGCFELANHGILFLDEVGDLTAAAQAKLLRVLETRSVRRLGGSKEIQVEVRVVTATNARLEELVEKGEFRKDLYYRLNVFSIHLEPLHRRREDILPIADYFLETFVSRRHLDLEGFTDEARRRLEAYDYPGNVRELRNIIERAAILCRSGRIGSADIRLPEGPTPSNHANQSLAGDIERERLVKALDECQWNRRKTAKHLGIPYSTLRYRMKRFGI